MEIIDKVKLFLKNFLNLLKILVVKKYMMWEVFSYNSDFLSFCR